MQSHLLLLDLLLLVRLMVQVESQLLGLLLLQTISCLGSVYDAAITISFAPKDTDRIDSVFLRVLEHVQSLL